MSFNKILTCTKAKSFFAIISFIAIVIILNGCGNNKEDKVSKGKKVLAEKDGVMVELILNREELKVAEQLKLKIKVIADEGIKINLPDFGEELGDFIIASISPLSKKINTNKKLEQVKVLTLNPFLSGPAKIPTIKITFGKNSKAINTPEIPVTILSSFKDGQVSDSLSGIADPLEYPESKLWVYITLAVFVLLAVAIIVWQMFLHKKQIEEIVKTPYEIASEELEKLKNSDLIDKGLVKEFYSKVSDILRIYIEGRFSLRAPESTTEEFLDMLKHSDTLSVEYKNLLREFLQHCDMVKFAGLSPSSEDIDKTFNLCERFIKETKPLEKEQEETTSQADIAEEEK
jgi:hypothetical protein